eukprot:gene8955-2950_t
MDYEAGEFIMGKCWTGSVAGIAVWMGRQNPLQIGISMTDGPERATADC